MLQFSNSGGPWASLVGSGGPASFTTLSANYLCADAASQDACLTREGPSALAVGSAGGGAGGTIDASLYELNGSDALDLTGGYTALHGQLGTGVKLYGAVTFTQNLLSSGNPPTVSSCGTGSVAAYSSDAWGAVTATGATACTVTFSTAYPNAAFCTIEDMTTLQAVRVSAISASAFTVTGLTSGDEFMYHCGGQ